MVQSWFKVVVKRRNALIVVVPQLHRWYSFVQHSTWPEKTTRKLEKRLFVTSIKHCRFKAIYIDPYFPNLQKRAIFARFYLDYDIQAKSKSLTNRYIVDKKWKIFQTYLRNRYARAVLTSGSLRYFWISKSKIKVNPFFQVLCRNR